MKLAELLKKNADVEWTVWDKDHDIEVYFSWSEKDEWDKAMNKIAGVLEVAECDEEETNATVNLSDVIEKNIDNGVFKDLFINNDVDSIMDDIEHIFAGYVSEEWLVKFADSLSEV